MPELLRSAQAGSEEAKNEILKRYRHIVDRQILGYSSTGLDADLFQAGCIGLLRAVSKYDTDKLHVAGTEHALFSHYAYHWVRSEINDCYANHTLRNRGDTWRSRKAKRAAAELETQLEREPDAAEVAEATGYTVDAAENHLAPTLQVEFFDEIADTVFGEAELDRMRLIARVKSQLAFLSPREQTVIRHRFGLDGARELYLHELAVVIGVCKSQVKRIESAALAKLRGLYPSGEPQ